MLSSHGSFRVEQDIWIPTVVTILGYLNRMLKVFYISVFDLILLAPSMICHYDAGLCSGDVMLGNGLFVDDHPSPTCVTGHPRNHTISGLVSSFLVHFEERGVQRSGSVWPLKAVPTIKKF